jgi:hypothetical protein
MNNITLDKSERELIIKIIGDNAELGLALRDLIEEIKKADEAAYIESGIQLTEAFDKATSLLEG